MSRSFKHHPCCSDYSRSRTRFYKKLASKAVRKIPVEIPITNASFYKKLFESWDIFDWKATIVYTETEFYNTGLTNIHEYYSDYKEYLRGYYEK